MNYHDNVARSDTMVQEAVSEAISQLKAYQQELEAENKGRSSVPLGKSIFAFWSEIDLAVIKWAKEYFGEHVFAAGSRDENDFEIELRCLRPSDYGKFARLFDAYDKDHDYDPDEEFTLGETTCTIPVIISRGILHEVLPNEGLRMYGTTIATYDGVFFMENNLHEEAEVIPRPTPTSKLPLSEQNHPAVDKVPDTGYLDKYTEFNIIVKDRNGQLFFWDSYRYQDIIEELPTIHASGGKILGYVCEQNARGYHVCQHSALDEDLAGYVDSLQDEEAVLLDTEKYIVCWYECDEAYGLIHRVDFGLTKAEILDNVRSQKYVEGATYIPETALLSLNDIEKAISGPQPSKTSLDKQIHTAAGKMAGEEPGSSSSILPTKNKPIR